MIMEASQLKDLPQGSEDNLDLEQAWNCKDYGGFGIWNKLILCNKMSMTPWVSVARCCFNVKSSQEVHVLKSLVPRW